MAIVPNLGFSFELNLGWRIVFSEIGFVARIIKASKSEINTFLCLKNPKESVCLLLILFESSIESPQVSRSFKFTQIGC